MPLINLIIKINPLASSSIDIATQTPIIPNLNETPNTKLPRVATPQQKIIERIVGNNTSPLV